MEDNHKNMIKCMVESGKKKPDLEPCKKFSENLQKDYQKLIKDKENKKEQKSR